MGKRSSTRDLTGMPFAPPGRITRLATRARSRLLGLHRSVAPPPVRVLEGLFGLFDNRTLGLLVELEVPEALDGSLTTEELADRTGTDPESLERLLRYAAGRGFLACRKGRWQANGVTKILKRDNVNSWRGWVEFASSDWFWDSWRHGGAAVRGEGSGTEEATGEKFFRYTTIVDPHAGEVFNEAMAAGATLQAFALARGLDWKNVREVCDVGGGTGAALTYLLEEFPSLSGTLFDLPEVVAKARDTLARGELAGRCRIVGGDFFEEIPAGADRYLLMAIVHDWDDTEAAALLRNVATALARPGSRAFVVENILSNEPKEDFVAASDLLMLVLGSGRERTQAGFEELFRTSGLDLIRTHTLPSGFSAFELGAQAGG